MSELHQTVMDKLARLESRGDPAIFISMKSRGALADEVARLEEVGPIGRPLYGLLCAVKDNIDVAGLPTTAACPAFAYTPARSAFVVEKLEAAGAIVVGKTNLDQFATGLVGVRSPYGVPRNVLRSRLITSSTAATAMRHAPTVETIFIQPQWGKSGYV